MTGMRCEEYAPDTGKSKLKLMMARLYFQLERLAAADLQTARD